MIDIAKAVGKLEIHARSAGMTNHNYLSPAIKREIEAIKSQGKFSPDKEKMLMKAKQGFNGSKRLKGVRLERVLADESWISRLSLIACSVMEESVMQLWEVFCRLGGVQLRLRFRLMSISMEGGEAG